MVHHSRASFYTIVRLWGMSQMDYKEIDSFHRRQLRRVLGVKLPTTMRNSTVYEQSGTKPISVDITQASWKLVRHLRLNQNTPVRMAMKGYFQKPVGVKKFRGKKRTTIVTTINENIKQTARNKPNFHQ